MLYNFYGNKYISVASYFSFIINIVKEEIYIFSFLYCKIVFVYNTLELAQLYLIKFLISFFIQTIVQQLFSKISAVAFCSQNQLVISLQS